MVTYVVDANVVVYAAVDGENRDACVELLAANVDGVDGRTSAPVLEEVWPSSARAGSGTGGAPSAAAHPLTGAGGRSRLALWTPSCSSIT